MCAVAKAPGAPEVLLTVALRTTPFIGRGFEVSVCQIA